MPEKKPRKKKEIIVRVESAPISRLREAVIDYREREKVWKFKVNRLEWEIQKLKESKKEIREEKNKRYDKLRWQLYKRDRRIWVLLRIIKHRNKIRRGLKLASYKKGITVGNRKAKTRWLDRGKELGVSKGYRSGVSAGRKIRATKSYWKGVQAGKNQARKSYRTRYNFRRKFAYKVESVSRLSVIIARLGKALNFSNSIMSYLFWCSQHEFWTKKDIDASFNDIGFDGYYTCVNRLKRLGLIEVLTKTSTGATWRLTYKGNALVAKMNAYIGKYFNKNMNK